MPVAIVVGVMSFVSLCLIWGDGTCGDVCVAFAWLGTGGFEIWLSYITRLYCCTVQTSYEVSVPEWPAVSVTSPAE